MSRPANPKLCLKCGRRGRVTDSRPVPSVGAHKRHHVCKCGNDWNTYELAISLDQIREFVADGFVGRVSVSISTPGRQVIRKP